MAQNVKNFENSYKLQLFTIISKNRRGSAPIAWNTECDPKTKNKKVSNNLSKMFTICKFETVDHVETVDNVDKYPRDPRDQRDSQFRFAL